MLNVKRIEKSFNSKGKEKKNWATTLDKMTSGKMAHSIMNSAICIIKLYTVTLNEKHGAK